MKVPLNNFCSKDLEGIAYFIAYQLNRITPISTISADTELIKKYLEQALVKFKKISNSVNSFVSEEFNLLHTEQYMIFLYLLSHVIWKSNSDEINLSERIFMLNKSLNSINLHHEVLIGDVFFICHGVGTVLGRAKYGDRNIFFQNVTVGRVGNNSPVLGDNIILYPNVVVTGSTVIGSNSCISAGTILHNVSIPENSLVRIIDGSIEVVKNKYNRVSHYLKDVL